MRPILASSIYCVREGKVLLLERRRPPMLGYWVAPGGKLEPGESPYEAACRELHEETGLRANGIVLRGIIVETSPRPDLQWLLFYFVATAFDGEMLEDSPEGRLAWWPRERVAELTIPEADRVFFPPIIELTAPIYQAHFRYDAELRLVDVVEHGRSGATGIDREPSLTPSRGR